MKFMPVIALALFSVSQVVAVAGGMVIQNLPNEPDDPNPVCRDTNGKLANSSIPGVR